MTNIRKSHGYGENAPPKKDTKASRTAAAYGAPVAATAYYGADARKHRRFPWLTLLILCILAVLFVIGLCKYGIKDTVPYSAPTVPTTVYVSPPVSIVDVPLSRAG